MLILTKIKKINENISKNIIKKYNNKLRKYFNYTLSNESIVKILYKSIIYIEIGLVIFFLSFTLLIINNAKNPYVEINKVDVLNFQSDDKYIDLMAKVEDEYIDVSLMYPKTIPTDEDIVDRLLNLVNEKLIKGNNKSLSEIKDSLNLVTKNNYNANIVYESEKGYIDITNGNIIRPYKNEGDYKDTLKVIISLNDIKKIKEFYVTIKEKEYTKSKEKILNIIKKIKKFENSQDAFSNDGSLIKNLDGEEINWFIKKDEKVKISYTYLILIIVILILSIVNEFTKKKKEIKKEKIKIENEFTSFIEDIYLLNNAGINLSNSIIYINDKLNENKKLKTHLNALSNEIKMGFNQYAAIEKFASEIHSEKIKKFIKELIVNLKRGNPNMNIFLIDKVKEFNGNKKDLYLKLAEENNIKALLPLMIILIATMILVVYPAIVNMSF